MAQLTLACNLPDSSEVCCCNSSLDLLKYNNVKNKNQAMELLLEKQKKRTLFTIDKVILFDNFDKTHAEKICD